MHISEIVFRKKKIFYFLLVAIVFGGIFSYKKISKLEDPEITVMIANVITVYPGASAHEVELKVTNVLEDEISALADLAAINSRSEANISIIQVELEMTVPDKEIPQRWEFLRRKIALAIPKLPEGAQEPTVIDDIGDVYGLFYAMVADDGFSYMEMADYADFVKNNMLAVEGVRKVTIYGTQAPQVTITLSEDKLSEMGVLPMQIFAALSDYTKEVYGGNLFSSDQQLRVSVDGQATSVEGLSKVLVSSIDGSSFKLGDIADLELGYVQPARNTLFVNNQKATGIGISMEKGENIIKVGERVEKKLAEIRGQIPNGVDFAKVFFQSEKVRQAINGFMWNLVLSVVIVIIVLMFTMGLRGGAIIGSGLVLTILATFPFLLVADGSLQRISLGAFIVAMGMLVDNAIVVLDGILVARRKKRGKAVYTRPAKQTAIPLLGATLIAISAFLPVYLSSDTAGTYVRDLFLVLAISLGISWLLALTQVPLFSAIFLKKKNRQVLDSGAKDMFNRPLYRVIKRILEWGMHHRSATIGLFAMLLLVVLMNFNKVDKTFFPNFNYNQCYIEFTLPKGSTPDMVNADLREITTHFNSYDEVKMVVSSHGMTPMWYCLVRGMMTENADNYGELIVNFEDYETMQKMRPRLEAYLRSTYPEALSRIRNYSLSIKATHTVEAEFSGPDPAVLKQLAHEVEAYMMQNPHTDKYTICHDWEPAAKTLRAVYSPLAANKASINREDISMAILAATDGLPVAAIYDGETAYPVRFQVRDKEGLRIEDLNDIPVWPSIPNLTSIRDMNTIMGIYTGTSNTDKILNEAIRAIPLSAVTAGVQLDWEEPVVRRRNGVRVIQAQCEPLHGVSPAQVQSELDELVQMMDLPTGYGFRWVGEGELKADGLKGILSFLPLAGGIMLLTLLLLFNDYRRPLIIILCLPLSVIGIIPGLLLAGQPFSFIAIVGVVGLSGMIIKNAIVLLDQIKIQLKTGVVPYRAVVDATILRVRPVMMASMTTILGMIPLLPDPMYASMAVAIIAGLLVGTLVTLVFVPILYSIFFGVKVISTK